jgi:hypothetical protein
MAVEVIDKIKPKNGGSFPIVEAVDVEVSEGVRLPEALESKADVSELADISADLALKASQSDLDATNDTVASKANATDVNTSVANLQSQIDNIITPVTEDAEVQNARVDAEGVSHATLKERIDSTDNKLAVFRGSPYTVWDYVSARQNNKACDLTKSVGSVVGAPYVSTGKSYFEIICKAGDEFEIKGDALAGTGLFAFVDVDRKVISKNTYGAISTYSNPIRVTAPAGTVKLLVVMVNDYIGYILNFGAKIFDIVKSYEGLDYKNYICGSNEEFTIVTAGLTKFDAWLKKGITYTYTNGTSSAQSLAIYDENGQATVISDTVASNSKRTFTCDKDYVKIGGTYNGTGTATLTSAGIVADFDSAQNNIDEIKAETALIEASPYTSLNYLPLIRRNTACSIYQPVGNTVGNPFSSANSSYFEVDCSEGENFLIKGDAVNDTGLWTFVDSDRKVVSKNAYDAVSAYNAPVSITAPDNAAKLLVNMKNDKIGYLLKISNEMLDSLVSKNDAWINESIFEVGSIYSTGQDADSAERLRTKNKLIGAKAFDAPEGYLIAKIAYFNADGTFYTSVEPNTKSYYVSDATHYYRIVLKREDGESVNINDIKSIQTLEYIEDQLDLRAVSPIVKFETETSLPDSEDVSADLTGLNFNSSTIMESLYEKWDSLLEEYPDYVERVDAAELLELEYPEYASYNTYLYSFKDNSQYTNGVKTRKRKMLLIGNLHGDEVCSPFVLYRMMKKLCQSETLNAMKLRAAYDIYVVPILNQWGSINKKRTNGNGVDINRNFPTKSWDEGGSGTDRYTGPTAGSEFETQIVMGLTNLYVPDLCIDFHNYASLDWQFYTETATEKILPLTFQSLVDMSFVFRKDLPEYFGRSFKLYIDRTPSAPVSSITSVYSPGRNIVWWQEEKGITSVAIEMSANINYLNGEINHQASYTVDAFAVGEYTYWVQLLKYAEYALRNTV